jgi:hypothetical protein
MPDGRKGFIFLEAIKRELRRARWTAGKYPQA